VSEASEEESRARDAALRFLGVRARSVAEMRRRLRRKSFPTEVIEGVIGDLRDRGLLDDEAFAGAWVRERIRRRPRGRFALVQELRKRGIDRARAEAAVDRVLAEEEVSEEEIARRAAEAWLARRSEAAVRALRAGEPGEEARSLRRKLYAHLERRGFPRRVAREVLDQI